MLGPDFSVSELGEAIVARAAGNPFFAQEMVRDLAERGVLGEQRQLCLPDAMWQRLVFRPPCRPLSPRASIASAPVPRRTINAAAVTGLRFTASLLTVLGIDPVLDELVEAELIDQVRFTPRAEYAFRHPLIRAVAYESQLKSDRAHCTGGWPPRSKPASRNPPMGTRR